MLNINKQEEIKRNIKTLFHMATLCKYSSKKITEEYFKIKEKYPKRITTYEKFYFKGIYETLRENFENENIVFCHELKNDEILIAKSHKRYDEIVGDGLYYKDCKTVYFKSEK